MAKEFDKYALFPIHVGGDVSDVMYLSYARARQLARKYLFDTPEEFLHWMQTPTSPEVLAKLEAWSQAEEEPPLEDDEDDEDDESL